MFFIGPYSLIHQGSLDQLYYINLFLAVLSLLGLQHRATCLPILTLILGISTTFMKSAFMIVYLRLTCSTVLQLALQ